MNNQDLIIVTFGFGPTYRDRVKYQINEASTRFGYDKVMKYFILTDRVEDFIGLDKNVQDLIVDVVDIEECRKDDEFSKLYEPLPEEKIDDELYATQLRYNSDVKKLLFSYGLKRYALKALAQRGITKFLYMDADIKLHYDHIVEGKKTEEEFWGEFDIPVNCIKGCGTETLKFTQLDKNNDMQFIYSKTAGSHDSVRALQASSIVMYKYFEELGQLEKFIIPLELTIIEGPVRIFNFESVSKLESYFNTLNSVSRLFLQNGQLYSTNLCGGYILCDYLPLSVANSLENIQVQHLPGHLFEYRNFFEDRFWGTQWYENHECDSETTYLISTKSKKEFLKKNEKMIECMKKRNQWPYVSWSCI
jgi:hypothetical protein